MGDRLTSPLLGPHDLCVHDEEPEKAGPYCSSFRKRLPRPGRAYVGLSKAQAPRGTRAGGVILRASNACSVSDNFSHEGGGQCFFI